MQKKRILFLIIVCVCFFITSHPAISQTVGFNISGISGNTNEAGGTATFTVSLNTSPADHVVIGVRSSDIGEGTVSHDTLTFHGENWANNQTVTVTGVNDFVDDGDIEYTIILSPDTSTDSQYNGLNPADVSVTNKDDDNAGFVVSSISGNTIEVPGGGDEEAKIVSAAGQTATFTVKLTSSPPDTSTVTIPVSSSDTSEGTIFPTSLIFSQGNWSVNKTVTVYSVDDDVADGNITYSVILAAAISSDSKYNGLNPADVSVTNEDNEEAESYTVTFSAGAGGSITGSTSQIVTPGGSCTAVTATPNAGYIFSSWSGGFSGTNNPVTITNVNSNMTITANFIKIVQSEYNVTFVAEENGQINGVATQTVKSGEDCSTVTAIPDAGYEFTRWRGEYSGKDNPLTITDVKSDMTITASFMRKIYTAVFTAGPNGSISGHAEQTKYYGYNLVEVVAVPDEGYEFAGWSGDYTGDEITLQIKNITSDMNITANFKPITYSVVFSAGDYGMIEGEANQSVEIGGESVEVSAIPNEGYEFAGWSGDYTGTDNPLTVENVSSDMSIEAVFTVNTYVITFNALDGGSLSGETEQEVIHGDDSSEITATAHSGFRFAGWSGDYNGTDNPLLITDVSADMTITANFIPDTYIVTFNNGNGGRTSGESEQVILSGGDSSAVTAVPLSGFRFTGWSGDYTGTDNPLTLTNVSANMTITANFISDTNIVTFTAENGGSLSGKTVQVLQSGGNSSAVTATALSGFTFTGWSGDYTGTDNPLTVKNVTSDMSIEAVFTENTHAVLFSSSNGGSIIGEAEQEVAHGSDSSEVTAIPDDGFEFAGWSGDYTGTDNPLTVKNVTSDMSIEAVFTTKTHAVQFSSSIGGSISGEIEQEVAHGGSSSAVTATASSEFWFTGWSGSYTGTENPLIVTNVTSDMKITAGFTPLLSPLSLQSPVGNERFHIGSQVSVTWSSLNITSVRIEYSLDNGDNWSDVVSETEASFGSYLWNLPVTPSEAVLLRITDTENPEVVSLTEKTFEIYVPIIVTAPDGGESLIAGAQSEITWSSDSIEHVVIDYSPDNGETWEQVSESTDAETGTYSWEVPADLSDNALIRVSDVLSPSISDQSDDVFSIISIIEQPSISLISPADGSSLIVGDSYDIEWVSVNIQNVRIDYSYDEGVSWEKVIDTTPASNGHYQWTVPETVSDLCLLRITDTNSELFVESESVFSILHNIDAIVITPETLTVNLGDEYSFSAEVLNTDGAPIDVPVKWSVAGEIGEIDEDGVFTAGESGFGQVVATAGSVSAESQVIVEISIIDIVITPEAVIIPLVKSNETVSIEGVPFPLDFLNGTKIFFPENSISENITITIKLPDSAQVDDSAEEVVFDGNIYTAFRIEVVIGETVVSPYYFNEPIHFSIPYDSQRLAALGIAPLDLGMFFFTSNGDIHEHGITDFSVDTVNEIVSGKVAHFSEIALTEKPPLVMLGDFDNNKSLDFIDYTMLVAAMNSSQLSYDIAGSPTTIPSLVYAPPWSTLNYPYPPDGRLDFEDLLAFASIYNWFNSGGGDFPAKKQYLAKQAVNDSNGSGIITEKAGTQLGDRFTVSFEAGMISGFLGAEMVLSYDSDVLRVVDISNNLTLSNQSVRTPVHHGYCLSPGELTAATVVIGSVETGIEIHNDNLFDIEFEVIDSGPYAITLEEIRVRDYRNNDVPLTVENSKIIGGIENVNKINEIPFALMHNSPNPFNMGTTIPYKVSSDGLVSISIYNSLGQEIMLFTDEKASPGIGSVFWDGMDREGNSVTSGVYIVRMIQGSRSDDMRILLLK